MSLSDRIADEDDREEGKLYAVYKIESFELQDHEETMVLSCENPMEAEP